jgi:hypothetical protein
MGAVTDVADTVCTFNKNSEFFERCKLVVKRAAYVK